MHPSIPVLSAGQKKAEPLTVGLEPLRGGEPLTVGLEPLTCLEAKKSLSRSASVKVRRQHASSWNTDVIGFFLHDHVTLAYLLHSADPILYLLPPSIPCNRLSRKRRLCRMVASIKAIPAVASTALAYHGTTSVTHVIDVRRGTVDARPSSTSIVVCGARWEEVTQHRPQL